MTDLSLLLKAVKQFRDERDWQQFHNHKDMAISLVLEATEVLEHFQWKSTEEIELYAKSHQSEIAEELADVLKYLLELADNLGVEDIVQVALHKLQKDAEKYPVEQAKGRHTKYTHLIRID